MKLNEDDQRVEAETTKCRFRACKTTTEGQRERDVTWTCPVHRAMLTPSLAERAQSRELGGLIQQGRLAIDGDGWLTPIPPTPSKPQPIDYTDDGRPRFRDTSSPTGLTWYPDIDICEGGSDPRLDRFRADSPPSGKPAAEVEANDDGE